MDITREMEHLLLGILEDQKQERPELTWLKEQYGQFMCREGANNKKAADQCLYQRIYGKAPRKDSDYLKIRYWRTGHHSPASHSECRRFGEALCMEENKLRFLLQGYYDSCDRIFQLEPKKDQTVYWKRRAVMEMLVARYLCWIPPERMKQMKITPDALRHNIRHLYYTDALCYVGRNYVQQYNIEKHIISINYESELSRNLKLLGVIPRKTMIRHLFIFGMPNLSLDFVNGMLEKLGYLPLQPEHTLRTGEHLDLLLIRLLQWYEAVQEEWGTKRGNVWLQEGLRTLDEILDKKGMQRQRFMFFKALESL